MTQQKIALVTGASRGIGRAIAQTLGQQGMLVVGSATSEKGANAITTTFADMGITGQGVRLDVADDASVSQVIKKVVSDIGPISVLVNNAGITRDNLLIRMKTGEWDGVINTNLTGVYRMVKACLRPMMKLGSGRIINITSVVAVSGNAGQANYSASKAGMLGFTKSLAREIAARNITVNAVAPGYIATDMTDGVHSEQQRAAILSTIPLNRLGQAEEVAAAVGFLASDAAGYITGETLHVNGGLAMV